MQYLQRVLDSGTGGYCYYSKSFNDPTPLSSETSPNYTGSISAHSILSVTPDAGSGSGAGSTFVWTANGNLNSYPLSTAGALDGAATAAIASEAGRLDGFRAVLAAGLIANPLAPVPGVGTSLRQAVAGTSGDTTVELYRLRAGTWTLICSTTIGFAAGDGGVATSSPASMALATLAAGDVLIPILVDVQANNPVDFIYILTLA